MMLLQQREMVPTSSVYSLKVLDMISTRDNLRTPCQSRCTVLSLSFGAELFCSMKIKSLLSDGLTNQTPIYAQSIKPGSDSDSLCSKPSSQPRKKLESGSLLVLPVSSMWKVYQKYTKSQSDEPIKLKRFGVYIRIYTN